MESARYYWWDKATIRLYDTGANESVKGQYRMLSTPKKAPRSIDSSNKDKLYYDQVHSAVRDENRLLIVDRPEFAFTKNNKDNYDGGRIKLETILVYVDKENETNKAIFGVSWERVGTLKGKDWILAYENIKKMDINAPENKWIYDKDWPVYYVGVKIEGKGDSFKPINVLSPLYPKYYE